MALIRPDRYVAWRGDAMPADADSILAHVTAGSPIRTASAVAA